MKRCACGAQWRLFADLINDVGLTLELGQRVRANGSALG
jgi:hypothetical protein